VAGLPARTLALIPISQRLLLSMSENCLAHRVSLLIIRRQNQKKKIESGKKQGKPQRPSVQQLILLRIYTLIALAE